MAVKTALEEVGVPYTMVRLGEVEIKKALKPEIKEQLNVALKDAGLELLDDKRAVLVERIKNLIIDLVHYTEEQIRVNLSDYLAEKLDYDYTYLSNLFAEREGTTIEQFFITHRIDRAKELLVYDEINLTEIAEKLHFSSVPHFCKQFKKITGLTPSQFKRLRNYRRGNIDNL